MVGKAGMFRNVGLCAAVGGLVLGAGVASAAQFDVTAEVQNTLAVTQVTPMNLGTLFVNETNDSGIGSLILEPDGGFDTTNAQTDQVIKSLGGQTAARASVATSQDFTVNVPTAKVDTSGAYTPNDVTGAAGIVELRLGGSTGDPNVARLYLANFTVGDITGGSETGGPAAAGDPVDIAADFGVAEVSFGIGAEIFTDDSADNGTPGAPRSQYQAGTYEGTFDVTAEF